MQLSFGTKSKIVLFMGKRYSVLPHERICVLEVIRLPRCANRKYPIDDHARRFREERGGCCHSNIRCTDWLGNGCIAVESHKAKTGNVDKSRIENMGIRQNEHQVLVCLVGTPARHGGAKGRKWFACGSVRIEEPA